MLADWRAMLSAMLQVLELTGLPAGYLRISMKTTFGLPFVAADERMDAAVLGMWGANYPNSHVLFEAAGQVSCPVLFMHKTEDYFFPLEGVLQIYNALPDEDNRMLTTPGPHGETISEQIEIAICFRSPLKLINYLKD
jgi:pimeloyl-ACP methyl ester carboxylesterase